MGATGAGLGSDQVGLLHVEHPWVQGAQTAEGNKCRTWLKTLSPEKQKKHKDEFKAEKKYIHTSL